MPEAWASIIPDVSKIQKIVGSWTTSSLAFTAVIDKVSEPNYHLLKITNQFAWPSKNSITIRMLKLTNPNID